MSNKTLRLVAAEDSEFELHCDPFGRLVFRRADGEEHVGVVVARAFPLTHRDEWIVVCTQQGEELITIENPYSLPPAVRDVLLAELDRREFLPVVRQIVEISGHSEPCEWNVETDRGRTQFILKNEEDVRRLGEDRALVIDAQGIRYLIQSIKALDAPSRKMLERYLY